MIDTQSVKTSMNTPLTSQGADAEKKIVGRKRGTLADTIGLILAVTVTAASLSENALGIRLLDEAGKTYPSNLEKLGRHQIQERRPSRVRLSESTSKSSTETQESAASTSPKGAGWLNTVSDGS